MSDRGLMMISPWSDILGQRLQTPWDYFRHHEIFADTAVRHFGTESAGFMGLFQTPRDYFRHYCEKIAD
jgi:hypothetical protein